MYLFIYLFIIFMYLFIYLFIYLFVCFVVWQEQLHHGKFVNMPEKLSAWIYIFCVKFF